MTDWNIGLDAMSPQEVMEKRNDFVLQAADDYLSYAKGRKVDYNNLDSFREKLVDSLERCIGELATIDTL